MINVKDLTFSYTNKPFIERINFDVKPGEIFGFLGPSGAGKSTLQKILTGLIPRYTGSVTVDGEEASQPSRVFYEKIGVDFEFPSLYEKLTGKENLLFFWLALQADARCKCALKKRGPASRRGQKSI